MPRTTATADATALTGLVHSLSLHEDPHAPLLLIVHGRAGTHDLMWTFARGQTAYSILAPQAPLSDPVGNYSWWRMEEGTAPGAGELERAAETLEEFLERASAYYGLAPTKTIALGFSQGAALLSMVLQRRPELFAGVGLLAGFVVELPTNPSARTPPPIFVAHGSQDTVVPIARAERGVEYLRSRGHEVAFEVEPVAHKIGAGSMRKLSEWLTERSKKTFTFVRGRPVPPPGER